MSSIRLERVQRELTSIYHYWIVTDHKYENVHIADFLSEQLPQFAVDSWGRRIEIGGVCVNGQRLKEEILIKVPSRIEYFEPKFDIYDLYSCFPVFKPEYILYEDEDVVIFYKPAGLPSVPSRDQNIFSVKKILQDYVGSAIHMPSRLDSSAQGVMVISKSTRMHPIIQKAFEFKTIEKYYILQVANHVDWESKIVENAIAEDPLHRVLRRVSEDGKLSVTHFQMLQHSNYMDYPSSFLQARPITGRTHQIRLHISHVGFPIIGDNFYEGKEDKDLHLLSYRMKFYHAFIGKDIDISVPQHILPEWMKNYSPI